MSSEPTALLTEVAVSALFAGVGLFLQAPIVAAMATKKSSFFIDNQSIRMVLLNKNMGEVNRTLEEVKN